MFYYILYGVIKILFNELEILFYSIEMGFSPFNSEIKKPLALAKTYDNSTLF